MKCDDCNGCVDFETANCVPKLWDLKYATGCHNSRVLCTYKPPRVYRTEAQKKEDQKTAESYNSLNYKGD